MEIILSAPWLQDDISVADLTAVRELYSIAPVDAVGGEILAKFFATFDSLEAYKFQTHRNFMEFALLNAPLPKDFLSLPWLNDGVTEEELEAVEVASNIFSLAPSFGESVVLLPWITDGVSDTELGIIRAIASLAGTNATLLEHIMAFSWLTDGVSNTELLTIRALSSLAGVDSALTQSLVAEDWIADGMSSQEYWAIDFIMIKSRTGWGNSLGHRWRGVRDSNVKTAITVMEETSELEELLLNSAALDSLISILDANNGLTRELGDQTWFQDGLTNREKALIIALDTVAKDPDMRDVFQQLLENADVGSTIVSLPSGADMNLYTVRRPTINQGANMAREVRSGMEAIEDFLEEPWNQPNVIFLLEPDHTQDRARQQVSMLAPTP